MIVDISLTDQQARYLHQIIKDRTRYDTDPQLKDILDSIDGALQFQTHRTPACECGEMLPLGTDGRPRKYCSDRCRQKAYRQRK